MFLALLFACGGDTTAATTPQPAQNSEVANILADLQAGQTPDPTPTNSEPPGVPSDVAERAPEQAAAAPAAPTPTGSADDEGSASGGRADSPECKAQRARRDEHKASIDAYREKDVVAAEQSWLNAEASLTWCSGDLECTSDGENFKRYHQAAAGAEAAYVAAQERVSELEAGFYPIDQELLVACGQVRD